LFHFECQNYIFADFQEHGLNAISALGCSAFGLRYLSVPALNLLSDAVTHRNDAIRAAAMHGLASLFGSQPDGADQEIFQSLFIHIGACNDTTTMAVLMGFVCRVIQVLVVLFSRFLTFFFHSQISQDTVR
jgi:hypothetical protein